MYGDWIAGVFNITARGNEKAILVVGNALCRSRRSCEIPIKRCKERTLSTSWKSLVWKRVAKKERAVDALLVLVKEATQS